MERPRESSQSEGVLSLTTLDLEKMTDNEKLQLKFVVDAIRSALDNNSDNVIKQYLSRQVSSKSKDIRTVVGIVAKYLSSSERNEANKTLLMDELRELSSKLPHFDPASTMYD